MLFQIQGYMEHNCVIVPETDKSDVSRTAGLNKWCIHPVRWKKDRCLKENIKLSFIQCTVCTVFTLDYGQLNKRANELFCVVQKSSAKKKKKTFYGSDCFCFSVSLLLVRVHSLRCEVRGHV